MAKLTNHVAESLAGKLVTVLGGLILIGGAAFLYTSIQTDKRNLMNSAVSFISSLSELTKRSVRHDMLTFQREDIQKTLESIGDSPSIDRVRIFNGGGRIVYSSQRWEIGKEVDKTSPACVGCHSDPLRPQETMVSENRWTIYWAPKGYRVLSFVEPIRNESPCFTAACHAHSDKSRVLGVLETDYSLQPIDAKIRKQIIETLLYVLSFLSVSVALLWYVLWMFVLRPVTGLSKGMKQVSSGDLLHRAAVSSRDEIGRLARTFNEMTEELGLARKRMERWTQSLEEEVARKTEEIRKSQGKLIQAEKLAALGRFTADIAHEIRNPLTALGGFGRRLQKLSTNEKEKEYADIVVSEVDRLEHILRDVMTFSRDARLHFLRQSVGETVRASLATFAELCDENAIEVEIELKTNLPILMDSEQIAQAVSNLISNAVDAMPEGGTLTVAVSQEDLHDMTFVAIHVSDTGSGIPEEDLPLIFEPFHTTKEIGYGTGLGLSISRKIMEEHGGFVKAENRPEGGLTVSLFFPYQSEEDLSKTPCWEFMKCGRDTDSELKCPAYPNFGRVCWVVAGTFCEGKVQGTYAQKCEDCRKCDFYRKVVGRQA